MIYKVAITFFGFNVKTDSQIASECLDSCLTTKFYFSIHWRNWSGDRVGLRSAIGNRVCLKRAPWVRIPPSPLGWTLMTENRESRQSRKAATVADLQGVGGRPFLFCAQVVSRRFVWSLHISVINVFRSCLFFTIVPYYLGAHSEKRAVGYMFCGEEAECLT